MMLNRLIPNSVDTLSSDGPYGRNPTDNFGEIPSFDSLHDIQVTANPDASLDDLVNDEAFPRDILDFGVDFLFDTPNIFDGELQFSFGDQQLLPARNVNDIEFNVSRSEIATPGLKSKLNILASAQAFKESLWLWTPDQGDHGALEQSNLSLPWDSTSTNNRSTSEPPPIHQIMNNVTRGKVLAMVLRTCEPVIYSHVVSNFPSAELLTKLIHNFINFHSRSEMPWIHLPTIEVEKEKPEFLRSMIAYGAAISLEPEVRKLGFAIQEALRMANPLEVISHSYLGFLDAETVLVRARQSVDTRAQTSTSLCAATRSRTLERQPEKDGDLGELCNAISDSKNRARPSLSPWLIT
jgi:hypothetical protein